jgi:small GTP-binding protein
MLLRFCEDSFQTSHLSTIGISSIIAGIDFKTKAVVMGGSRVKLQIWDTAGQERFKTITQTYYRGAMGIVLTYSIDDRNSFNDIENWIKQIKMHASSDVVKVLVGSKCDSPKREVTFEEGKKLARDLGLQFYETSAK